MDFISDFLLRHRLEKLEDRACDDRFNAAPRTEMLRLQRTLDQSVLLNRALWEIVSAKLGVTEEELALKLKEIDLRDGLADGRITPTRSAGKRAVSAPPKRAR